MKHYHDGSGPPCSNPFKNPASWPSHRKPALTSRPTPPRCTAPRHPAPHPPSPHANVNSHPVYRLLFRKIFHREIFGACRAAPRPGSVTPRRAHASPSRTPPRCTAPHRPASHPHFRAHACPAPRCRAGWALARSGERRGRGGNQYPDLSLEFRVRNSGTGIQNGLNRLAKVFTNR